MEITIRKASAEDSAVIAEIIWLSEKADYALYSYSKLFNLQHDEFIKAFSKIVNNPFDGHPLGYKSYWVIQWDGIIMGGFSVYEEKSINGSSILASGALMQYFPKSEVMISFKKLAELKYLQIEKAVGTFQLDSVAVFPGMEGKGIFSQAFHQWTHLSECQDWNRVMEVQVWNQNLNAIHVYEKNGFIIHQQGLTNHEGMGRVLMRRAVISE